MPGSCFQWKVPLYGSAAAATGLISARVRHVGWPTLMDVTVPLMWQLTVPASQHIFQTSLGRYWEVRSDICRSLMPLC